MSAAMSSIETLFEPFMDGPEAGEGVAPFVLHFKPIIEKMGDDEFLEFCNLNEGWRFEITSKGDLEIMLPAGTGTGRRNAWMITTLGVWAEDDGTGAYFDSDTMFKLPNGAKRAPDMAWVKLDRWNALSEEEQESIAPICPDFVVELRSRFDRLKKLQSKMQEYIENGAQLGWLIDPRNKKVYVYRPGVPVEELDEPEKVSGEPLLEGFVLPVARLWRK
jgi:Uma2 family endonuclease